MYHEDLLKDVKEAIDKIYDDTSVSLSWRKMSLEELISQIETMLYTLE